ncbi:MAG: GTP pyrophosphokinase family protein [Lachnospiraceae bacterium]|nr:GTP pyrophosphokinase family protein [Lachnospiraceae bacterium]
MDASNASVDSWEEVILIYNSAMKEMVTRLEILSEEFQHTHSYNPIEHLKSRLKSPESIVKKLRRHGYESSIENMVTYVKDIAGVRVICSFTSDVYKIAEAISAQSDIEILSVKDYIKNPKPSGYQSYHIIALVPVYLSDKKIDTKVEIQIRTIAMDFWASLEHKINYKFDGNVPEEIRLQLVDCAGRIRDLDDRMLHLNEEVQKANASSDN